MKFLLFGFLFLSTYILLSAQAPSVEELTRRAQALLQFASNEIKVLRAQNKTLAAEGLEQEEKRLLELEVELRAAATSGTGDLTRLKERLDQYEDALGKQLRDLGRDFVTQREKDEIIRRTQQTLNSATAAVTHLRAENRSLEAEGLIEQEKILIELEIQLRATVDHNSIRRLEAMLNGIVTLVNNELRRLDRSLKKRDLKDDLMIRAKELSIRAENAVKKLKDENRTVAAELIHREETNITVLILQIQIAVNDPEMKELEQRVIDHEMRLSQDLRRLGIPVDLQEMKQILIKNGEMLSERAKQLIRVLKEEEKTEEMEVIQNEERAIAELVFKFKSVTQESELKELEEKLNFAQFRLYEELNRQGVWDVVNREAVERITRRAEELSIRATIEIRKLHEEGKGLIAEGLAREERHLIELNIELRSVSNAVQFRNLEQRLEELELRVELQLQILGQKTQIKNDLIKTAHELEIRANQVVISLRSQNRTNAAELIESERKQILHLVEELANAKEEVDVIRLEVSLLNSENRLTDDLRRIGVPLNPTELRDELIQLAETVVTRVDKEMKVLQTQNQTKAVEGLEKEKKVVVDLIADLKKATQETQIRKLEESLSLAGFRLAEELGQLGLPFVDPERDRLIRRAEEISIRATIEIRKLRESGKALLAAGLEREEQYLVELDVELRTATTPEQIKSLEQRLNDSEKRVVEELKRLGSAFFE